MVALGKNRVARDVIAPGRNGNNPEHSGTGPRGIVVRL